MEQPSSRPAAARTTAPPQPVRGLIFATAAAYLVPRLPFLLADMMHGDQVVNGNLPHALLSGRIMPITAYQFPFQAQSALLVAPLVTPLYALFGQYNFVLSVLANLWNLGTVLLWTLLADAFASRRLAIAVAVVMSAATPFWNFFATRFFMVPTEPCLFSVIQVWITLWIARRQRRASWAIPLGLLAGYATMFSLHNVFTIAVTLAFLLLARGVRWWARAVPLYLAAHLVTFAPAIWFNVVYGTRFSYYRGAGRPTTASGPLEWLYQHFVEKLATLYGVVLPRLPGYPRPWVSAAYMSLVALGLLVVAGAVIRAWRRTPGPPGERLQLLARERPIEIVVLLFPSCFTLLYAASSMAVFEPTNPWYHRYVMPTVPALMVALAYGFARLGRAGVAALAVLAALSMTQNWKPTGAHFPESYRDLDVRLRAFKGYDDHRIYLESVPFYVQSLPADRRQDAYRAVLARVPEGDRWLASFGYGTWLAQNEGLLSAGPPLPDGYRPEHLEELAAGFAAEWTRTQLVGWRSTDEPAWAAWSRLGFPQEGTERRALVRGIGFGVVDAMGRGYGLVTFVQYVQTGHEDPTRPLPQDARTLLRAAREIHGRLRPEDEADFAFGLGWAVGRLAYKYLPYRAFFTGAFGEAPGWDEAFHAGVGRGIADGLLRYRYRILREDLTVLLDSYLGRPGAPATAEQRASLEAIVARSLSALGAALVPVEVDAAGRARHYRIARGGEQEAALQSPGARIASRARALLSPL